jgi:hypothetical protein
MYRLLKKTHLLRYPHPSSLRRTFMYDSFLGISSHRERCSDPSLWDGSLVSDALYLDLFEQPVKFKFFKNLLISFNLLFYLNRLKSLRKKQNYLVGHMRIRFFALLLFLSG